MFASVTDQDLVQLIDTAKERLIFVAPGASKAVAQAISNKWLLLDNEAVSIILDVDPNVCQLGFGTLEGLTILNETSRLKNAVLCHQEGIRICLLIVDDTTLIFSPTPRLLEAEPMEANRPNAILLSKLPLEIAPDLGLGENGAAERKIGLDKVSDKQIEETAAELKKTPPAKFDMARRVRVFQQKFQFVEFSLEQCSVSKRRVTLPSELVAVVQDETAKEELEHRLKTTFTLIGDQELKFKFKDPDSSEDLEISEKSLRALKDEIVKKYLTHIPRYGAAILKENMADFEQEVAKLATRVKLFQQLAHQNIEEALEKSKANIVEWLMPSVRQNPPIALSKVAGKHPSDIAVRDYLNRQIGRIVGSADKLVAGMKVTCILKDATWQSLNDQTFISNAKSIMPGLERLFEEWQAVEAEKLPVDVAKGDLGN